MREIEVKAKITDKPALFAALQANGIELSPLITQHDRVYGLPGVPGGAHQHKPWLRIREQEVAGEYQTFFTLKKSVTDQLDSIEHEVEVGDASVLEQIILQLDFVPYSDLTKTRQVAHLTDTIEICIDTVEPLGDFIEAEMLCADDVDYEGVIAQLWQALEPLGITPGSRVRDGYDVLMNKHLGKE